MNTEIEVKFLDVNFDDLRNKLKKAGAVCQQPMRLMRRAIIDHPDRRLQNEKYAFVRVRNEGDKVTMTYKQHESLSIDGAHEIEVEVSDFDSAVQIWQAAGLVIRSLQESKRETWKLDDVEVVLDEWPWVKPYMEIEGETESHLRAATKKLGLDWKNAVFGDVMVVYRAQYPHLKRGDGRNVGNLPEVRFSDPFPDLLKNAT